jgi:hypothetical protein
MRHATVPRAAPASAGNGPQATRSLGGNGSHNKRKSRRRQDAKQLTLRLFECGEAPISRTQASPKQPTLGLFECGEGRPISHAVSDTALRRAGAR